VLTPEIKPARGCNGVRSKKDLKLKSGYTVKNNRENKGGFMGTGVGKLTKIEKQRFDAFLQANGLSRGKLATLLYPKLSTTFSSDTSIRGTLNNWSNGHSGLTPKLADAIEELIGGSILDIIKPKVVKQPEEQYMTYIKLAERIMKCTPEQIQKITNFIEVCL
jgi:hypothetical protein